MILRGSAAEGLQRGRQPQGWSGRVTGLVRRRFQGVAALRNRTACRQPACGCAVLSSAPIAFFLPPCQVIMLVESPDGSAALLGRSKKIRPGMLTCLSGFVDQVGSSLSAALGSPDCLIATTVRHFV
jgi:hypothetical protein